MFIVNTTGLCIIGFILCLGVATAEVVVVVSPKNPATVLNTRQVTDIFLGKASRFPDGNLAMPIDQAEGTRVRDEFYTTVAGKSAAQVKSHWSKIIFTCRGLPPKEMANNNEVKNILANNLAAIGYIDKSAIDDSVKVLTISP